jgi:hypothetical protein
MTYPSSYVNDKRKVCKILGFQDDVVEIIALMGVAWLVDVVPHISGQHISLIFRVKQCRKNVGSVCGCLNVQGQCGQ